jgi:hypothetical protein
MRPEAVQQAKDRLQAATDAVDAFRAAKDFAAAERAWRDFLLAMGGIYNKLEQGAKSSAKSAEWFDHKWEQRRDDDLLRYLNYARNTDEHGLEPVTERHPGGAPLPFGHTARMSIQALDETMQPVGTPDAAYVSGPALMLTRVYSERLKKFCDPPRLHRGQALTNPLTESVTAAALAYGALMIREAEELCGSA